MRQTEALWLCLSHFFRDSRVVFKGSHHEQAKYLEREFNHGDCLSHILFQATVLTESVSTMQWSRTNFSELHALCKVNKSGKTESVYQAICKISPHPVYMGYWLILMSRWLDIGQFFFFFFFACLWTERQTRKKERGQYPAILTEQASIWVESVGTVNAIR